MVKSNFKFDLQQLVNCPARVTKKSKSIIDHIYSACTQNTSEVFFSPLSVSDHYPKCFTRSSKHSASKTINHDHKILEYRWLKKFNDENFIHDLLISGIECVETITDPNEALHMFYDIVKSVLNVHAPLKQKRIKRAHQPNWLNEEIKDLMYERDKAHKDGKHERYKILRNKLPV